MALITLYAHIKKDQIPVIESLFRVLKFSLSDLQLTNINFNQIEDKTLLSFQFNEKHLKVVIERFALNKIDIIPPDKESKSIIESAQKKLKKKDTVFDAFDSGTKRKKKSLKDLIKDGDYEDVIKKSRDVTADKSTVQEARDKLDLSISNAIKIAYKLGMKEGYQVEKQLNRLITIASDRILLALHKEDFMREAGTLAINLGLTDTNYVKHLINLTNNRYVPSDVAVIAAAKFSEMLLSEKFPDSKLVDFTVKNLNEKWLQAQFESLEKPLPSNIKTGFYKLIEFISKERENRK